MRATSRTASGLGLVTAALLALHVAGCGPSGANKETTVVVKPATSGDTGTGGTGGTAGETKPVAASGNAGTLKGRIVLTGTAPVLASEAAGKVKPDEVAVCKVDVIGNEKLVVGANNGVANVFVYLEKAPAGAAIPPELPEAVKFDNKDCRFVPHAIAVRVGQTVQVTNSDPIAHNTHTFPNRNKPFNQVIKPEDTVGVATKFDKPEQIPVQVKCDFHAWMLAYQFPLDHPFVAVTKADGTFEIPNMPPGKHALRIWHESAGYLNRSFSVTISGDVDAGDIPFEASKFATFEGPRPKTVVFSMVK